MARPLILERLYQPAPHKATPALRVPCVSAVKYPARLTKSSMGFLRFPAIGDLLRPYRFWPRTKAISKVAGETPERGSMRMAVMVWPRQSSWPPGPRM